MSQAGKALGNWHGQLREDVNKICDERNNELHKANEQIFQRLKTLEQSDAAALLSDQRQRVHLLEASGKLFVDKNKFNELTARIRRLEKRSRVDQERDSGPPRPVSRLDGRQEDIAAAECEISQLRAIESKHEEQSGARDIGLQQSVKHLEISFADLRKRIDVLSSSTNPSAPMPPKCRNLASEVNALRRRLEECDKSSQSNFRILFDRTQPQQTSEISGISPLTADRTSNDSGSDALTNGHIGLISRQSEKDGGFTQRFEKMESTLNEGLRRNVHFSCGDQSRVLEIGRTDIPSRDIYCVPRCFRGA